MSLKSQYDAAKKGADAVRKGVQAAKGKQEERRCQCGCRKTVYGPPGSFHWKCAGKGAVKAD